MSAFYRLLRKLPASTDSFWCPWTWTITWFGACATVSGIFAATVIGYVVATSSAGLLGFIWNRRLGKKGKTKGKTCST